MSTQVFSCKGTVIWMELPRWALVLRIAGIDHCDAVRGTHSSAVMHDPTRQPSEVALAWHAAHVFR